MAFRYFNETKDTKEKICIIGFMNKKSLLLFGLFNSIFFFLSQVSISAQRTIDYYEPDYTIDYAFHEAKNKIFDIFDLSRSFPWNYPVQYLQFFSPYAKENSINEIEKNYDNGKIEIHRFDESGYLTSLITITSSNTSIDNFYYNFDKTTIVKMNVDKEHNAKITSFYFNNEYKVDSLSTKISKNPPIQL